MRNVEDIYTSTPPAELDNQTRQLIETWETQNPHYQNTQQAWGQCVTASETFIKYAKKHDITLNALRLDGIEHRLHNGETRHARRSFHVVVDLGGGNIYDPTARQYHQNAPTPAYATYETMKTIWTKAENKPIKNITKIPNQQGWQPYYSNWEQMTIQTQGYTLKEA